MQHVYTLNALALKSESPHTRQARSTALRRILRDLHADAGAARLEEKVYKQTKPHPRNIIATADERARILAAAPPNLRCWLLLCSDMALRSGTAATITPEHYDAKTQTLTFTTKYAEAQRLPVTRELAALLNQKGLDPKVPYAAQLARGQRIASATRQRYTLNHIGHMRAANLRARFRRLKQAIGITRDLKPHDLRRTTAVRVYKHTRDLRTVQALLGHGDLNSTLWYLDHHMTDVPLEALEAAKQNHGTSVTPGTGTIQ